MTKEEALKLSEKYTTPENIIDTVRYIKQLMSVKSIEDALAGQIWRIKIGKKRNDTTYILITDIRTASKKVVKGMLIDMDPLVEEIDPQDVIIDKKDNILKETILIHCWMGEINIPIKRLKSFIGKLSSRNMKVLDQKWKAMEPCRVNPFLYLQREFKKAFIDDVAQEGNQLIIKG